MGLWGAPDFLGVSCCGPQITGIRMRSRGGLLHIVRAAASDKADADAAVREVLERLGGGRDAWLLVGINPEDSDFFHTELPRAPLAELAAALRFEAPREVMKLPEDFRLQFVTRPAPATAETVPIDCAVFAGQEVEKLGRRVANWRRKPDLVLSPLLALPNALPADAPVHFPDFEPEFYRRSGQWHLYDAGQNTPCNAELLRHLQHDCRWETADGQPEAWEKYLTPIVLARFGLTELWRRPKMLTALNLLPARLRPARYRTQLRLMVILALIYAGLLSWDFLGSRVRLFQEYRELKTEADAARERVAKLQKKLKSGEREQKELTRIADLKVGDRTVPGYLALLSEKLPDDVLVSSFRWNDGAIDLVLQTEAEIDLVSFFNRLTGFKVVSASQRTNNNNLTFANIKLTTQETGGKK